MPIQFWQGNLLFSDGQLAMDAACCCDDGGGGGTPACASILNNLYEETVFQHSMLGLADNNFCEECDSLNTTYALTWRSGCVWEYVASHCPVGDGGAVSSRFTITEDPFFGTITCELFFYVGRADSDQDGNPPLSLQGDVSVRYRVVLPSGTTSLPNPLTLQRVEQDTLANNGPCRWGEDSPTDRVVTF